MTDRPANPEFDQAVTKLQTLRDEIRVRVHLASLEVKSAWDALDPQVAEAEALAKQAGHAAGEKVHALVTKLSDLRTKLGH